MDWDDLEKNKLYYVTPTKGGFYIFKCLSIEGHYAECRNIVDVDGSTVREDFTIDLELGDPENDPTIREIFQDEEPEYFI